MKKIIIIVFSMMLLLSCSQDKKGSSSAKTNHKDRNKPLAWGHRQNIYVFADGDVWRYANTKTKQNLERPFYTTVNEKMFTIERAEYEKIDDYFRFNNLLFFCDWESSDPVSAYVKDILGDQVLPKLEEDGAAIFPVFNLWADDQLVLFIIGENEENLLKMNILQSEKIWDIFKNRLYKRIEYLTYRERIKPMSNFEQKAWTVDLPFRYVLYKDDPENGFTSYLGRSSSKPDRFFAVYHEKAEKSALSKDWLISKRNELAKRYYEGDYFTKEDIMISKYTLAGHDGWMIRGSWKNDTHYVGGAFTAFAFYDDKTQNLYLVDNSVYYPEGDKLPALLELEIISNSLKIK